MDSITDNFLFMRVEWIEGTYLSNFIYYEKKKGKKLFSIPYILMKKSITIQ